MNLSAPLTPLVPPVRVGIVGTGYVAKLRADALQADPRARLLAVVGYTPEKTASFAQAYQADILSSWVELVHRPDLDLVVISTINRDHGPITQAAIAAGKQVVVEYPIALEVDQAEQLVALANAQYQLLHVEHIELLGGVHRAFKHALPEIGQVFHARYATLEAKHPAPQRWTYQADLFGFPLVGALSRLHRLVDVFGTVKTVNCHISYAPAADPGFYRSCVCTAHLRFHSGPLVEVTYGKGEHIWRSERTLTVQGELGTLVFNGDEGQLIQGEDTKILDVGARRGLLAKDMTLVLDHLCDRQPLYVTADQSLYTLKVADAARRSAETGETVLLPDAAV